MPTYQPVNRHRTRVSGSLALISGTEPVTGAAQGGDQLRLEAVVDLSPQTPHEHLQQVGEGVVIVVPHVRGDRGAVQHLARVAYEQLEQRELLGAQAQRPPRAAHLPCDEGDLEGRRADHYRYER